MTQGFCWEIQGDLQGSRECDAGCLRHCQTHRQCSNRQKRRSKGPSQGHAGAAGRGQTQAFGASSTHPCTASGAIFSFYVFFNNIPALVWLLGHRPEGPGAHCSLPHSLGMHGFPWGCRWHCPSLADEFPEVGHDTRLIPTPAPVWQAGNRAAPMSPLPSHLTLYPPGAGQLLQVCVGWPCPGYGADCLHRLVAQSQVTA